MAGYGRVPESARPAAMGALCSQPRFARALLTAVRNGGIGKADITPYHARQIAALADSAKDPELAAQLKDVWGEVRTTPEDKLRKMADFRTRLTPEVLAKADIEKGRAVFTLACASCHTLYDLGQNGTNLGPNLTGSGRTDVGYLLENMVDPSALVPADYKMSVIALKDGRVLSGFIAKQNEQTLTLRTITETLPIGRADVVKIETSTQSLMPEGLLDALTPEQQRDLFGFLLRK
jgi:putative heme-binding domain-containing protein